MIATVVAVLVGGSDLQTIEAEGLGPRSLGHTQAVQFAKDAALRQVVLTACKRVEAADPRVAQCALADERLFAGFKGVVTKLDVLSQEVLGDSVKVKVRAEISLKAVSSEEVEAERLLRRLGTLLTASGVPSTELAEALLQRLQKVSGVLDAEGRLEGTRYTVKLQSTVPPKELAKSLNELLWVNGVRAGAIEGTAK